MYSTRCFESHRAVNGDRQYSFVEIGATERDSFILRRSSSLTFQRGWIDQIDILRDTRTDTHWPNVSQMFRLFLRQTNDLVLDKRHRSIDRILSSD